MYMSSGRKMYFLSFHHPRERRICNSRECTSGLSANFNSFLFFSFQINIFHSVAFTLSLFPFFRCAAFHPFPLSLTHSLIHFCYTRVCPKSLESWLCRIANAYVTILESWFKILILICTGAEIFAQVQKFFHGCRNFCKNVCTGVTFLHRCQTFPTGENVCTGGKNGLPVHSYMEPPLLHMHRCLYPSLHLYQCPN